MDWFSSFLALPTSRPHPSLDTQLMGPRLLLRMPDSQDWKQWRVLRDASRDFLVPWEPEWPPNCLTYNFYCSLLRRQWRDWRAGKAFTFSIFLHEGERPVLVGGITLGDVHFAAAQKGTIGYWVGKPYAGQGIMTEALGLVCDFAFDTLRLHRVEASCLPHNNPSKALLRKCDFVEEGFAKAYLQINGKREDHLLWGRVNPRLAQA